MLARFPKDIETIAVGDEDDLASLLDRADDHPLVLERNGVRYALNREDIGAYYDPEAVREAMRTAPRLTPEVAEALKEQIARRRGEVPVGG